jgi:hypothetical protein
MPSPLFCSRCCLVRQLPVQVAEVLGGGRGKRGPAQRFYPQCQRCSIKQASAVRNSKRVLVLHLHWPRRGRGEHLSGEWGGRWGTGSLCTLRAGQSRGVQEGWAEQGGTGALY